MLTNMVGPRASGGGLPEGEFGLIVPVMTTDTDPAPFVASSSSFYSTSYRPFWVFSRNNNYWLTTNDDLQDNGEAWIQIEFGSVKNVTEYGLGFMYNGDRMPKNFQLEDLEGNILDEQVNQIFNTGGNPATRIYQIGSRYVSGLLLRVFSTDLFPGEPAEAYVEVRDWFISGYN